jgi:hypothetical protein
MHRGAASQWKEGEDFGCGGLEDIRKNPLYTHVFSKAAESPDSGVKFKCNEIEKNKTNGERVGGSARVRTNGA